MKALESVLAALALSLLTVEAGIAGQITGGSVGLASPASTITFEEVALAQDAAVTTQFAAYGAVFSGLGIDTGNVYGGMGATGFTGGSYVYSNIGAATTPVVISFNSPVSAAAIAAVDQGNTFTVSAYLGGVGGTLVDTFDISIPFEPGLGFIGFTNEVFDTMTIQGSGALGLDTLESNSAVPEPGTVLLIGLGLIALAARRRATR